MFPHRLLSTLASLALLACGGSISTPAPSPIDASPDASCGCYGANSSVWLCGTVQASPEVSAAYCGTDAGQVDADPCLRCVAAGWVDTCRQIAYPDSESCLHCGVNCDSGVKKCSICDPAIGWYNTCSNVAEGCPDGGYSCCMPGDTK